MFTNHLDLAVAGISVTKYEFIYKVDGKMILDIKQMPMINPFSTWGF